jgi:D-lactate dehydrogenase
VNDVQWMRKKTMNIHQELSRVIQPSRVLTSSLHRIAYANDASYFRLVPQAVVQPNSIAEIQSLFKFTQQNKIPMTFRAAGTSLSGQAVTDGILVDISKHWGKYRVEDNARLIRTQPGIVGGFLNNVLKPFGRRIGPDPASIDACMLGGILANNSSGMCCGVTENAYRTIHSMTMVLPDGLVLNTADPDASLQLHEHAPGLESGLLELKRRILESKAEHKGETLAARIRRRYQMKNNNGYLLNAFLDFDTPLDILTHLMIGSEGTLGFIAEAVLHTLPDYLRRYTGQLYFRTLQDAADAIYPLQQSGARAAEIMDRPSLRSIESLPGAPALLAHLPETAAAILVEYQSEESEGHRQFQKEAARVVKGLRLLHDAEFTEDPIQQAALWKLRKGIIPSVGAVRPSGTTLLCEDIVFPVPSLANSIGDLQHLFNKHGYPEGVVFGHAKDGNLHFLIAQSFSTEAEIARFESFTHDLIQLVSGKYDGALKAEHGTGRNMAPFVETEWGTEAYAIMRDLKSLFDPGHMLNPGVLINDDPRAHVTNLKSIPLVSPEVDQCIECGFCEPKCPSRSLTLTPRQRIVVQRELARMRTHGVPSGRSGDDLDNIEHDFIYAGIETCAMDGMCATACPVNINTGNLTGRLRRELNTAQGEGIANWIAEHFSIAESALGTAVRLGHAAESMIGAKTVAAITETAERLTGTTLPKWNSHISYPAKNVRGFRELRGEKEFIYFPSCISRQLGVPGSKSQAANSYPVQMSLSEAFLTVARRANIWLSIPEQAYGHCCGMPFHSKGYEQAYQLALHKTLMQMWEWSGHGKYPIVIDTTSCTQTFRTCKSDLGNEDQEIWKKLTFLDSVEFLHDIVLSKLNICRIEEDVVLHPNCSARKLGLDSKLVAIAKQCARSVIVPINLGCCAFAGDRGLLFPELTAAATQKESAEVLSHEYGGYYSSNIPCEMGMSEATGKDYVSIIYLVERASRA